jgi:hypothetical protein
MRAAMIVTVAIRIFILSQNVKEHATLSARASVDDGVEVECRKGHENRAADRGCVSRLVRLLGFLVDAVSMKFCP